MAWFYQFLLPFLLTILLTPIIRKIALKFKILDYPNRRKPHLKPTPLLGGIAIYIAFASAILINFRFSVPLKGVALGATIILLMGFVDDIKPIPAEIKLVIETLAVLVLIRYGVIVTFLPNVLWGKIGEVIITLIWVIGITNALNFMDGLDGLATGLSSIAAGIFFIIAIQTNQTYLAYLTIALLGAALGFIPYNFHPAKIFLGDSGSNFLGFTLAALAVMGGWAENNPVVSFSVPILVLGILIFDMIYITIARIKQHKVTSFKTWLEYVGKDHFHHRLLNMGFSERQVAFFMYSIALCLGLGAIALRSAYGNGAILLLIQATIIFLIVTILMNHVRKWRYFKKWRYKP